MYETGAPAGFGHGRSRDIGLCRRADRATSGHPGRCRSDCNTNSDHAAGTSGHTYRDSGAYRTHTRTVPDGGCGSHANP